MNKIKKIMLLWASAANLWAAGAAVTTKKDAEAKLAATKADKHKIAQIPLGHFTGYSMTVTRRQASGVAELHKTQNDVFVVESGEATLVTGGTIVGAKTTAPGEVRGASIAGGERRKIGQGDFVHIPANIPHQFLLDAGGQITYAVVKTAAR
jgi:mannose-6-phosphate isomerase-like protein (cupin superfamily)